jgi:hypothetical protein
VSAVSPDDKSILASHSGYKGLYIIDIGSKKISKVTDLPGAGYEPCFSDDGSKVYFRSDEMKDLKKYSSLSEYNIVNGKTVLIENNVRDLSSPVLVNKEIVYSVEGKSKKKILNSNNLKSYSEEIYVVLENLTPALYINGTRKVLTPSGEGNYIWISLSPDKTMLLYNYQGKGTFVSDLQGKIISDPGRINAPVWLDNKLIVGMNDKDDGYRVTGSDIICYSIPAKTITNLTSTTDKIEMYPLSFRNSYKIVYQTINGELYIMDLNVRY